MRNFPGRFVLWTNFHRMSGPEWIRDNDARISYDNGRGREGAQPEQELIDTDDFRGRADPHFSFSPPLLHVHSFSPVTVRG